MSFYDDASLVLIPSGIKTSKVYSQKPTDGTGDFTVTRASTATRTNESGVIESVASNVPRLDYMTASGTLATCPMLEVEGQRTNLVLRSEEFDNIYWTKTSTSITANNATAPDGTSSADRLVLSGTTSTSRAISRNLAIVTSTTTVTFSAFVKYVDKQYVQLTFSSAFSSNYANFDLINGTVTAGTYVSASIQSFANGWYRISITTTGLNTACLPFIWAIDTATAIRAANSTSTGTSAYLIWGAQIEDGFFLSTYISTAAATVTRLKDDVVLTGVSALIGQTEGTIFLDVDFRSVSTGGIRQFFQLEGSVGSQVSGTGAATSSNGNNISFSGIANYTLSQGRHKIVCVYNQTTNESKLFVDGAQRGTTGTFSGFLATVDRISILARIDTFSSFAVDQQQFGGCNQFAIWKTALTDAQCNQLSTL